MTFLPRRTSCSTASCKNALNLLTLTGINVPHRSLLFLRWMNQRMTSQSAKSKMHPCLSKRLLLHFLPDLVKETLSLPPCAAPLLRAFNNSCSYSCSTCSSCILNVQHTASMDCLRKSLMSRTENPMWTWISI